jgi:hypothetical protein
MVSLRELGADGIARLTEEIIKQSDRGAAVIGGAIVEAGLTDLLHERLIGSNTLLERLFSYEANGALATFGAKIDVGIATGATTPHLGSQLHLIRKIRNKFAHNLDVVDFTDKEVSGWASTFDPTPGVETTEARGKFIMAVGRTSLAMSLLRRLFTAKLTAPTDEQMNVIIDILDKVPVNPPPTSPNK